jgi:hypothetical protein
MQQQAAAPAKSPQQLNALQRQLVLSQSVEMTQQIYSGTVNPAVNNILNVQPRNVGLIKRFIVEIVATLNNTGADTATLTDIGLANLLSNVNFTDLNNNTRINTTGLHLTLLSTAKRRHPFSSTGNFNTADGNNLSQMLNVPPALWPIFVAPTTIATGTSGTVRAVFEVPLAYSDDDLRGSVYANVINATMQLGFTFNINALVAANTDYTNAVYAGSAGTFTSATVTVTQVYLDQLPFNAKTNAVVLPVLDLSTVYELKSTNFNAISENNDFPIPYANFRDFLSVFVIYNSNSAIAAGRTVGTDMNYLALQTANFTNIIKQGPLYWAKLARDVFNSDLPAGIYYVNTRKKPVSTTQYGNEEIILNVSTSTAQAYAQVYWEDMALLNTLASAGSLAG